MGSARPYAAAMAANPEVDEIVEGSEQWREVLTALRPVLLGSGLAEEVKWAKPTYCHDGANIAIVQEMKGFVALMFFKGALLGDPAGILHDQGPNSRSARRIEFTSVDDVTDLADTVAAYLDEAVAVEEAGLSVEPAPEADLPEELQARLDADPTLRAAWDGLTPGRRREYALHVGGAKQSATRTSRVDKVAPRILAGQGLHDR